MPNQWTLGLVRPGPTDEQLEKLCEAAQKGRSIAGAAGDAELSHNTVDHWLKKGRRARERLIDGGELTDTEMIYADFVERFERARAVGIRNLEDVMTRRAEAGNSGYAEAGWRLERIHRREYGRQPDVIQGGQPVVIVVEGRPSRELPPEAFIDGEGRAVGSDEQGALPAAPAAASVP